MDALFIVQIILAIAGITMLTAVFRRGFKKKGAMRNTFLVLGIIVLAYGIIGVSVGVNLIALPAGTAQYFSVTDGGSGEITCPAGKVLQGGVCVPVVGGGSNYQPTASYTTVDKYSASTSVSGTSYYKVDGDSAKTTAYTNVNVGDDITYWVSNSTYWVQPVTKTATQGVNTFEAKAYQNGSASITVYDTINRATMSDGAYNTSLGANDQANFEITYQGTSEYSATPFGGVMVIESNSTIASLTCSGDSLLNDNPYHLTYTTDSTSHTFWSWAYDESLDDGTGTIQRINCQVKNGGNAVGAGSIAYLKFIPANWYISNDGDILLDTEKYADSDNTRTGSVINTPSDDWVWGA